MTKKNILFLLVVSLFLLSSCKKEKESRTIVTTIEEPHFSKTPLVIGDTVINKSFDWDGAKYSARIERKAIKNDSTTVKDDYGQKYYDNNVTLTVNGPDGQILSKTFAKKNFSSYINPDYIKPKHSALMGIAFNRVEKNGNAIFVATVGSPDSQSDEFMSVQINIDKHGSMTMSKLQEMEDEPEEDMSE